MTAGNWPICEARVREHEGGNSDDPRDPGGRTSRGTIQREWTAYVAHHPGEKLPSDVWQAPDSAITDIYRTKYWDALRCDDLPAGVDYAVLDYGINSGIARAAKVLQRLVGVAIDGKIGPATLIAAAHVDARKLVDQICDERLAFLQSLSTWPAFGRGWGRRVREVRALAHKMASEAPASTAQAERVPEPTPTPSLTSKPMPVPAKIGLWAAIVATAGGVAHWLGDHVLLTSAAVIAAAILAPFLLSHLKHGD